MKIKKLFSGCLATTCLIAAAAIAADSSKMMSVQVKTTSLRNAPEFISKACATLAYGDRVEVSSTKGPWSKVNTQKGATGWVHTSALSPKKIVLKSGQETAQTRASSDELALAGKGFNSDVEGEFKKQHKNINFIWINKMEKMRISSDEMQKFLKEGSITPKKGGAK